MNEQINKSYVTEGVKNRWETTQIGQLDARLSINFLFSHDNLRVKLQWILFTLQWALLLKNKLD